ncbi:type II secretion system F family protein [Candidatus Woesearchaeota archaeon]|nr:type II secretion system F family protein [Candidatus Woesearchaeota archaeon]
MFYEKIEEKIENAERIIDEIENIKRQKSDAEKEFNGLNKEFYHDKIAEDDYKKRLKNEFEDGKVIKQSKLNKRLLELFNEFRDINKDICSLFEVLEEIKKDKVDIIYAREFARRLKKYKGEEEKIKYSTYSYNFVGKYANVLFNKFSIELARKYPEYFKELYQNLRLANIRVFSNTYINISILGSCIGSFLSLIAGFLIFSFSFLGIIQSFALAFFSFLLMAAIFYFYPKIIVDSRRREIKNDLPFAILHMAAVAGSGAKLIDIFGMLLRSDEYKALSGEIKRIMNYVNLFGYNLTNALKNVAATTPSNEFKELINGMIGSIESGGSIKNFLKSKAEDTLIRYRLDRKKYVEVLSTYSDIYTAILIAAPLLFVIVLVLISIVGTKIGGLDISLVEKLGTFVVVPALNIGFIVFMNIVQPEI